MKKLSEKENLQSQMDSLLKDIDTKRTQIMKLTDTCLSLQERTQEFKLNSTITDSRTAYAISLYSKISNITWNYQAPANHLSGCK